MNVDPAEGQIASTFGSEASSTPPNQEQGIRRVADLMHRLNLAIAAAVDNGVTVELMRCSRHHNGEGDWGDQMQPIVRVRSSS